MSFKPSGNTVSRGLSTSQSLLVKAYKLPSQVMQTRIGKLSAVGMAGVMAGKAVKSSMRFRENLSSTIYQGSSMPIESGRIGVRSSSQPVSMTGMKFSFRRTK